MKKIILASFTFVALALGVWLVNLYNRPVTPESIVNSAYETTRVTDSVTEAQKYSRDTDEVDFSGINFTPWDVNAASQKVRKREKKPYTIMIYMNGSDLESENGAATDDIVEMLDSGVSAEKVNIVLFTGGTNRWMNDVIPENECVIWEIENGQISRTAGVGLVNMGDAGTLASFIKFGVDNYPADKYGLIMWDHGGGSIAGYGHDEKFNESWLSLLDMNYSFERAGLAENRLEFLGFDSCLMATVEMAVVASDYANFLVGSEDLEPGEGWDYGFLATLNSNPAIGGAELGKAITDRFMDYYEPNSDEDVNMSVVDLSKASMVMESMGRLTALCSDGLITERAPAFRTLAMKRSRTKTFGSGSPRDNDSDMVDIGDMARKLADVYPEETAGLLAALNESVIYNRNNSGIPLSGLSTYYVYKGREAGKDSLEIYKSLNMDDSYTGYLHNFFGMLSETDIYRANTRSRTVNPNGPNDNVLYNKDDITHADLTVWRSINNGGTQTSFMMTGIKCGVDVDSGEVEAAVNARWPRIDGNDVCMFEISSSDGRTLYAVPAERNGRECDIIVLVCEKHPDGIILGARSEDGFIIQKGHDIIRDGDSISFYYQERSFGDDVAAGEEKWRKSAEMKVNGELKLEWGNLTESEYYYSLLLTDIRQNEFFTDLCPVKTVDSEPAA